LEQPNYVFKRKKGIYSNAVRQPELILSLIWQTGLFSTIYTFNNTYDTLIPDIGALILLIHLSEYFIFIHTIAKRPKPVLLAFILTTLYGVLYIRDITRRSFH